MVSPSDSDYLPISPLSSLATAVDRSSLLSLSLSPQQKDNWSGAAAAAATVRVRDISHGRFSLSTPESPTDEEEGNLRSRENGDRESQR